MSLPQIIILSGCSSSGKTSIACLLQEKLSPQYLNFSIDAILDALPASDLAAMKRGEPIQRAGHDFGQLVRAYHYALPGLLQAGCSLILDNGWSERVEKRELLTELAGYRVALIGVHCDLAELRRRELARGDRAIGLAAWEFDHVHQDFTYDLEINTTGIAIEALVDMVFNEVHSDRIWHGAIDTLEHLNMYT